MSVCSLPVSCVAVVVIWIALAIFAILRLRRGLRRRSALLMAEANRLAGDHASGKATSFAVWISLLKEAEKIEGAYGSAEGVNDPHMRPATYVRQKAADCGYELPS